MVDTVETEHSTVRRQVSVAETPKSPGNALRARRQELGWSEEEAAESLKITVHLIRAMEWGNYDVFHSITYARAFVRAYAQLMGIDPDPLVAYFSKAEGAAPQKNLKSNAASEGLGQSFTDRKEVFRKGFNSRYSWLKWVILALIVVIAVVGYVKCIPMLQQVPSTPPIKKQKASAKQDVLKSAPIASGTAEV